jgi:hypothetical protein
MLAVILVESTSQVPADQLPQMSSLLPGPYEIFHRISVLAAVRVSTGGLTEASGQQIGFGGPGFGPRMHEPRSMFALRTIEHGPDPGALK